MTISTPTATPERQAVLTAVPVAYDTLCPECKVSIQPGYATECYTVPWSERMIKRWKGDSK